MDILKRSFIEVMRMTIGMEPHPCTTPLENGYLSSIKLDDTSIYILASKPLLLLLAKSLLFEDTPTEEVLQDLTKELANLIIGKAKILSQEAGKDPSISIPLFHEQITKRDSAQTKLKGLEELHFALGEDAICTISTKG